MDDDDTGLVDQEAIHEILLKAQDALRPLGLSFEPENVMITVQGPQIMAMIPAIVRSSAKKRLTSDRETQDAFNKMMAQEHDAKIQTEHEKMAKLVSDPSVLERFLFEEEDVQVNDVCLHTNRHPSGFCLDCGEGLGGDPVNV